ncbi:hypothetical protein VTO42DRAFT_5045 [Malbranchea cinnamomea]
MASSSVEEAEIRNRLPTLLEVLNRRTLAPVDLFSFYIYMRDQQCSVDYLDFWLDISQHMSLCRHYVRELRRSVLLESPEAEKVLSGEHSDSPHNAGLSGYSDIHDDEDNPQRLSAFLRSEGRTSIHSGISSQSDGSIGPGVNGGPGSAFVNGDPHGNDPNSPGHTVTRSDIRASAVRILYTYLLPGSEREVVLPEFMVNEIIRMIEEEGRDDPEVFDSAKDYVFQAMERDAFPGFLQAKALGNLVPLSILIRLILALISLGGGFWAAWYVVLSDQPRNVRCWVILPFAFGTYFLSSYQYKMDPILALIGLSEYTFMNFTGIREPYVRTLLNKRALACILLAVAVAVALSILFIFVPGHHL